MWIEPGANVFLMQAVVYNRGTSAPENKYDPEKVDFVFSLQLGKAHIIMLYWFLRRVLVSVVGVVVVVRANSSIAR